MGGVEGSSVLIASNRYMTNIVMCGGLYIQMLNGAEEDGSLLRSQDLDVDGELPASLRKISPLFRQEGKISATYLEVASQCVI